MGFVNYIFILKQKDHINHSLDLSFDKNDRNRKSSEDIKSNLKMVSGLNTEHISKKGALFRNYICEYLWFKKQYFEDCNFLSFLRILSSFDRVMQFFWLLVIFVNGKIKKLFINLVSSSCIPVKMTWQ